MLAPKVNAPFGCTAGFWFPPKVKIFPTLLVPLFRVVVPKVEAVEVGLSKADAPAVG